MPGELILIVEDNEQNRKVARDLLQVHGYVTIEAENGEDAIALVATRVPDLVVMDVRLPGMSGVDTLAKLRAAPTTRDLPVLAFTASVMPQDRSEIMAAGFDAFLSKPIDLEAFLQAVADALKRRRSRGAP